MKFRLVIYNELGEEFLEFGYDTKEEAGEWGAHYCESNPGSSFSIYEKH